jgi:hypothetical protein
MNNNDLLAIENAIKQMGHSPVSNYVLPGLTSWLIGGGDQGCVRMFTSEMQTQQHITPHTHRFDFTCLVVRGSVKNQMYAECDSLDDASDWYMRSEITRNSYSPNGEYNVFVDKYPIKMAMTETEYLEGQVYSMKSSEYHSITFSRDAVVLFLEGKEISATSKIIEPYCGGKHIPTFKTENWMFLK